MRNACLSKEDKRLMKPVIEKRRRDRINQSLEHLRTLLLEATQDESLKNPKTEKADILKKTVLFLKTCHTPGPEDENKTFSGYEAGFQEGLTQASSFLNSTSSVCEKKRNYLVGKLCRHMEEKKTNGWKDPIPDDSVKVKQRHVMRSPPQITRTIRDLETSFEKCAQNFPPQPLPQAYPSASCSNGIPLSGHTLPSTPPDAQSNSKMSIQRTLIPVLASSFAQPQTALVWRPWP